MNDMSSSNTNVEHNPGGLHSGGLHPGGLHPGGLHPGGLASRSEAIGPAQLLNHPQLWRAGELPSEQRSVSSGFDALDDALQGGWPEAGLAELLCSSAGIGELRLLLPMLRTLSSQERWIAWINPPHVPYAPALAAAGIDTRKILVIHPKDHREALWAAEQTSRSGNCSAVLAWFDEKKLKPADTRRLQIASKNGNTLSLLFRPQQAEQLQSMAELRLRATPSENSHSLTVDVFKRRGGWPVSGLELDVGDVGMSRRQREIRHQLELWREQQAPAPQPSEQSAGTPGFSELESGLANELGQQPEIPTELAPESQQLGQPNLSQTDKESRRPHTLH